MLETSARLLRLLSLLQTPREWTGAELAQRLEVSTRTVRNDVERLRALGYPVHANRGAVGGYRLAAGANLPPLLLDDEEAVAVAVGLRTATGGSVTGIEETALRALAKLEQVLPSRLRRRVNTLQTYTVTVTPQRPGPQVDADVLTAIAAACRDHERLRFDYRSHGGGPHGGAAPAEGGGSQGGGSQGGGSQGGAQSRRDVEPYRLVTWGRRWYLVAWDTGRGDWRTFRVDRLTPVIPTGPRFVPRELPDPDLARYVSRGVATAAWRYRAQVIVQAPAQRIAERLPMSAGTVQALDERRCAVDLGADSPELLAVWLGALGADFTVVDAPELARELRRLADRYRRAIGPVD